MTQSIYKRDRSVLVFLICIFLIYSAAYIYTTSFIVEGQRYFCLFDDAMISMRYAHNLAEGNGLVMNPGERVEGITNPLWAFYMTAVHKLPIPLKNTSLVIQITAALCLALNLVFIRRIARLVSDNKARVAIAAMFLTAFYLPLINWSLQGMEVSVLTLLMSVIVCRALRAIKKNRFSWDIFLLLGIGTFIRIDMAVPFIGIWFYLIAVLPEHRRRNILWGAVFFGAFLGSQTVARLLYYGDVFPNTYYLKMVGYPLVYRLSRGLIIWWKFAWSMNLLFFLTPVMLLVFAGSRRTGLLGVVVGMQMLYSIYVGGDAWDDWGGSNRYIAIVIPQFFILIALGLSKAGTMLKKATDKFDNLPSAVSFFSRHYYAPLILLAFLQLNSNAGTLTLRGLVLLDSPPHRDNNHEMVQRAQAIKQITLPDAKIAVTWAGIIPYFSERYTVDILGKTDKTIAHIPMRTASETENRFTHFLPGHLKYDYSHSIGELKPDAVLQFWGDLNEANQYISEKYARINIGNLWVYVRNGSEYIRWDLFTKSDGQQ